MEEARTFGVWDYVVMGGMLCVSSSIGVYFRFSGGKQKTTNEYLLGDRSMPIIPVSFSLMAGLVSAIVTLGVSVESYTYGTMFAIINLGYLLATPLVCYVYLPVFFRLQYTSIYRYLEDRFGVTTRLVASTAFCLQAIAFVGIVLFAPALALEAVTGLNRMLAILLVGCVCTFYSTIGGVKAVIIADLFQTILMFVGTYLVVIQGSVAAGGLDKIWAIALEGGRIELDNVDPNPAVRHTWWSLVVGGCIIHLGTFAVNQLQVQRLLSVNTLPRAQKVAWLALPILSFFNISTLFCGLILYSKYKDCDPLLSGKITSADQMMPYYVMENIGVYPALAGLFTAGVFSGSLSTVSSALNSLAAVTLEDYLKPGYRRFKGRPIPETHLGLIVKLMALGFGFVCLAIAFLAEFMGSILNATYIVFGIVGGPLLAIFSLGMFTTFTIERGAISGLVVSIGFMMWIALGGPRPKTQKLPISIAGCDAANVTRLFDDFDSMRMSRAVPPLPDSDSEFLFPYRISYMWYGFIGFVITFVVGAAVSYAFILYNERYRPDVHPDLFTPLLRTYVMRKRAEAKGNWASHTELVESDNRKSEVAKDNDAMDEIQGVSVGPIADDVDKRDADVQDQIMKEMDDVDKNKHDGIVVGSVSNDDDGKLKKW